MHHILCIYTKVHIYLNINSCCNSNSFLIIFTYMKLYDSMLLLCMLWNGMISKQALSIFNFLIFSLLCCTHAYDTCILKRISKGINISIFSTLSTQLHSALFHNALMCFQRQNKSFTQNTFINSIHHYYVLHLTPLKCVLI